MISSASFLKYLLWQEEQSGECEMNVGNLQEEGGNRNLKHTNGDRTFNKMFPKEDHSRKITRVLSQVIS